MAGESAGTSPAAGTARSTVAKAAEAEAPVARQAIGASMTRAMPLKTTGGQSVEAAGSEAAGVFSAGHRRTGQTVLGSHPGYIAEGERVGARYFNMPTEHYEALTPTERWAANQRFLDRTITRGDDVLLTNKARPGTTLAREVGYLEAHGYTYADELRLVLRR